jgi:hypothetical protein
MSIEPFTLLISGPSGIGKTSDILYAFPTAIYIARGNAIAPCSSVCGFKVPPERILNKVRYIDEAVAIVAKATTPVVIDDLTVLADQTVLAKREAGLKNYAIWYAMLDDFLRLRVASNYSGQPVIMNCHERESGMDEAGKFRPGGIELPGRSQRKFPPACDVFVRAAPMGRSIGWPACYRVRADDPNFQPTRDRFNTVYDQSPLNIAELLRSKGVALTRIPEVDKWEDLIEKVSTRLVDSLGDEKVIGEALTSTREHLKTKGVVDERHLDWVLRDTYDRAQIKLYRKTSAGSLFRGGGSNAAVAVTDDEIKL